MSAEEKKELTWMEKYPHRLNPKVAVIQKEGMLVGHGDKQRVIPPDEVYKLASLHCTLAEIADYFNTTPKIISYNFADLITKAKAEQRAKLRKAQFDTAIGGNAALLIFLGKNYLGQSDQPQQETQDTMGGVEFTVNVVSTKKDTEAVAEAVEEAIKEDNNIAKQA